MSSSEPELVTVGRVGRAHGVAGAFVVEEASTASERFAVGATLYVGGEAARVLESKRAGGRPVIRLERTVERGAALTVRRAALPSLAPDSYYVLELVGLSVQDDRGRQLGRVVEVAPGVANDVLELDSGLSLPLVEACVRRVELARGRILVDSAFGEPG